MSLIDEALRRAQAAQSAQTQGPGFRAPMPLPDSGRSRRRRMRLLAGWIAALAVAAAGAVFFLGRRGSGEPKAQPPAPVSKSAGMLPAPTASPAPEAAGPTPIATAPGVSSTRRPQTSPERAVSAPAGAPSHPTSAAPPRAVSAPAGNAEPAATSSMPPAAAPTRRPTVLSAGALAPTPRPVRREPPAEPVILPPVEVANASASPRIAAPPRPPRAETPREAPSRTRTYAGSAMTPTGKLELEGIVYSETHPTALINGHVVAPGGYVEGYTVVSIGRDRVELENEGGRIVLTLR